MARGKRRDPERKAKPAPATGGAARRRGYQKRSRWQPLGIRIALFGGLALSAILILNGSGFFRPSQGVGFSDLGRGHVPPGSPISYSSIPPTSGSHYLTQVAPWGSYTERLEDPVVVHNLEHGGIAIAYNGIDEATVQKLEGFLTSFPPSRYGNRVKLVIHPDDRITSGEIVLTAWTRMDRLTSFDEARIRSFYDAYLDRCCEAVP